MGAVAGRMHEVIEEDPGGQHVGGGVKRV
jgi:hypothetical protein